MAVQSESTRRARTRPGARSGALAAVAALLLVAAGCGSSSSTASAGGAASAAGSSSGVARAEAMVARYSAVPTFPSLGTTFDAAKARGRTIYVLPIESSGFNAAIASAFTTAAKAVGVKAVIWPTTGELSQYQQFFVAAINAKASLIDVQGISPTEIGPQLAAAKAAHIPVTLSLYGNGTAALPAGFDGGVNMPWSLAGELEADYAIVQDKGDVHAVVLTWSGIVQAEQVLSGVRSAFRQNCPACTIAVESEPVTSQSSFSSATAAGIQKSPDVNYVIPVFDSNVSEAESGIGLDAATSRVEIDSLNGTPSVLSQIKGGGEISMDIGESASWIGYAAMSNDLRVLVQGKGAVTAVPPREFTSADVAAAGDPPSFSDGYGGNLLDPFLKVWDVR